MKIALLSKSFLPFSGWGQVAFCVREQLEKKGVKTLCMSEDAGYRSASIAKPKLSLIVDITRAQEVAKCDLIHVLDENYFHLGALLGKRFAKPTILTIHGSYGLTPLRSIFSLFNKALLHSYSQIICPSQYTFKKCEKHIKKTSQVKVVPWGASPVNAASLSFEEREAAALLIGPIKPRKGILYAIKALEGVLKIVPHAKLYIAGEVEDEGYFNEVMNEVVSLRLGNHVIFRTRISEEEKKILLGKVRCVIAPSISVEDYFEGFGLVHLEAFSEQTPSIGSADCAHEEVVMDEVSGFIVPQKDYLMLTERIILLLTDKDKWEAVSFGAGAKAERRTWVDVGNDLMRLYSQLLESPR